MTLSISSPDELVAVIPHLLGLWLDMNRGNAASHVALWTDITGRAPDEVRAAPASLLGFAGWLSGHGALAWCALDQVPKEQPYGLAQLVATAVQCGLHPREWEAANSSTAAGARARLTELGAERMSPRRDTAQPALGI